MAAITGTVGDDLLIGTSDNDTIDGGAGRDTVQGGTGNDSLTGGPGDDQVFGEDGDDTLVDTHGVNVLDGGSGNDQIEGPGQLLGGAGDDQLEGAGQLLGGAGNDSLSGTGQLYGEAGDDTVVGSAAGAWLIDGGDGNDQLGALRFSTVLGGAGDDAILSSNGAYVEAGSGNDIVRVASEYFFSGKFPLNREAANIFLDDGDDVAYLISEVGATVTGGAGDDTFYRPYNGRSTPFVVNMDQGRDQLRIDLTVRDQLVINGFTAGGAGDVIRFGHIGQSATAYDRVPPTFSGWFNTDPFVAGRLRLTQSGSDTLVEHDSDGGVDSFVTVATLRGVTASSLTAENFGGWNPQGHEAIDFSLLAAQSTWNGNDNPFTTGHLVLGQAGSSTVVLMDVNGGADSALIGLAEYRDRTTDSFTAADFGGFAPSAPPAGRPTDDVITATFGSSYLFGGAGDDTLTGSASGDRIYGGSGFNSINAGNGSDYIRVEGDPVQPQVINAGAGDDTIELVTRGGITLGEGRDTLRLDARYDTQARVQLIVGDFAGGPSGDIIDATVFLRAQTNWTAGDPFASGHLAVVQDGLNTRVMFDLNGGGDRFETLLFLSNLDTDALTADNFGGFAPVSPTRAWSSDSFTSTVADELFRAGNGVDTVVIPAATYDSTLSYTDGRVIVNSTTGGRDFLEDVERLSFQDRVVTNIWTTAPELLVDDVYYFARNPDIFATLVPAHQQNMPWLAAAPDAHYMNFGWREGRDPNAFFDTTGYRGVARSILDAGENPLTNYLNEGAGLGYDPSLEFDGQRYLVNNPDVAAAGMNPLVHYLLSGQAEGRATYMAVGDAITAEGFDAQYYLFKNPDVAAGWAGDPYTHFMLIGWREGRDPNAYFDTSYYLGRNPDVANAALTGGMNPLTHFHLAGFIEGRDPSAVFDLDAYFAAHPDVDAANVNPLVHLLQVGVYQNFAEADWIVR